MRFGVSPEAEIRIVGQCLGLGKTCMTHPEYRVVLGAKIVVRPWDSGQKGRLTAAGAQRDIDTRLMFSWYCSERSGIRFAKLTNFSRSRIRNRMNSISCDPALDSMAELT